MRTITPVNIENRQNYFSNDMTNVSDFDPGMLNIDQISSLSNELIFYGTTYVKDLNGSKSLYLAFNNLDACIEENGEKKYLIFASTDKNEMMLGDYTEIWDEIKEQIKLISRNNVIKYSKDFRKIKFESDDDLPIRKIINIPLCVIIIRGVFEEDSNYYPQVLLNECFYEHEEEINLLVVN